MKRSLICKAGRSFRITFSTSFFIVSPTNMYFIWYLLLIKEYTGNILLFKTTLIGPVGDQKNIYIKYYLNYLLNKKV